MTIYYLASNNGMNFTVGQDPQEVHDLSGGGVPAPLAEETSENLMANLQVLREQGCTINIIGGEARKE